MSPMISSTVLYLENVSGEGWGGVGAKLRFQERRGGGQAWNPTVLSDLCNINLHKA